MQSDAEPRVQQPEKRGRHRKGYRRGRLLTKQEQQAVVDLLSRGWGRAQVCRKLGFSYQSMLRSVEESASFAQCVEEAALGRDEAVEMALYKAALEGKVSAQKFWFQRKQSKGTQPQVEQVNAKEEEELRRLSDRELIERARAAGIDLPPAVARRLAKAYRSGRSGELPTSTGD